MYNRFYVLQYYIDSQGSSTNVVRYSFNYITIIGGIYWDLN